MLDGPVFAAVLVAALLHAFWNTLLKSGSDRQATATLLAFSQAGLAACILPFVAAPAPAAWPWIGAAAVLHTGYKLFLIEAYRHGDLSQAYPLARGAAPLIVAVVAALALGEMPTAGGLAAIVTVSGGVLILGLRRGAAGERTAVIFALGTACFTAGYTVVDAIGARLAGTASGFILWMTIGDAALMGLAGAAMRGRALVPKLLAGWTTGLAAGALSLASYWIAVWAFTRAPVALVAALRESSILFAVLIAALVLKERVGARRWLAAGLIAAGVAMMRL